MGSFCGAFEALSKLQRSGTSKSNRLRNILRSKEKYGDNTLGGEKLRTPTIFEEK